MTILHRGQRGQHTRFPSDGHSTLISRGRRSGCQDQYMSTTMSSTSTVVNEPWAHQTLPGGNLISNVSSIAPNLNFRGLSGARSSRTQVAANVTRSEDKYTATISAQAPSLRTTSGTGPSSFPKLSKHIKMVSWMKKNLRKLREKLRRRMRTGIQPPGVQKTHRLYENGCGGADTGTKVVGLTTVLPSTQPSEQANHDNGARRLQLIPSPVTSSVIQRDQPEVVEVNGRQPSVTAPNPQNASIPEQARSDPLTVNLFNVLTYPRIWSDPNERPPSSPSQSRSNSTPAHSDSLPSSTSGST